MSAAPFATSGECDTMTMPTFFAIECSDSTLQSRFQKFTYCRYEQFSRSRAGVHVPLASLTEERRAAAPRDHRYRLGGRFVCAFANFAQRAYAVRRAQLIERGHEHVEHRLVSDVGAPEFLDHADRLFARSDDALLRELVGVGQMLADRREELSVQW